MPFNGDYQLTQEFGVNPERYKSWGGHMGLDYRMPEGTPVLATQAGTVIDTGWSPKGGDPSRPGTGGFGNWVLLDVGNGYTLELAHFKEPPLVKKGDVVEMGQELGLSGNTGVSDFPHLHFGVRKDGEYVDPHTYLDTLQGQPDQMAQVPVTGVKGMAAPIPPATATAGQGYTNDQGIYIPPPVQGLPNAPRTVSSIPISAEDYRAMQSDTYRSPIQKQAQAGIDAQEQQGLDYGRELFPKYFDIWTEYDGIILDKDREVFRGQHPEVMAVSLAVHNPVEVSELERQFGPGSALMYSRIPKSPYDGGAESERAAYYQDHPDAFLVKAWVDGRPEPRTEGGDPTDIREKNWGSDYREAEQMFGSDIWNTVRQYQMLPDDGSPESRKARALWHEANRTYDAWESWWYAKMPDTFASASKGQYSGGYSARYGGNSSAGFSGDFPFRGLDWEKSRPVELARARRNTGNSLGDWRKYFAS